MARYVDADELLKNLKKQYGEELGWQCTVNMSDVGMMIEDAPAADVVEVVRCKDCEHYDKGGCNHFGYYTYTPSTTTTLSPIDVDEDDFCSYGERRIT